MKKIFLITLIFLLTGCFNYRELNDIAIITSIGIDYDKEYKVSFLIADSKEDNSNEYKSTIITGNGKTLEKCFSNIKKKSSKKLYYGHLKLVIINENILDISYIINTLTKNYETLRKVNLVLAHNTSSYDLLDTPSKLDSFSSSNIIEILKNNTKSILLSEFIYKMINDGYDNILPSISLENEEVKVSNIGVFSNNKLVGYLDNKLSKLLNKKINISLDNDLVYNFNINEEDYSNLEDLINYSISYNSDFLGLGNMLYKKNYHLYKDNSNILNNLKYTIKAYEVKKKNTPLERDEI